MAIVNNPALLEEKLKEIFANVDKDSRGYLTPDQMPLVMQQTGLGLNLPWRESGPTQQEIEQTKKLCDPQGTGKITFEGYKRLVLAIIEKAKQSGKL